MLIQEEVLSLRNQGLTTVEIGERVGKSSTTIWRWLKKRGDYKSLRGFQPKEKHLKWKGGNSRAYIARLAHSVLDKYKMQSHTCWRCDFSKGNGERLDVHHIDRDRSNNSILNLEVLCSSCHRIEHHKNDTKTGNAKIDKGLVEEIRYRYEDGDRNCAALGREYGIGRSQVWKIVNNKAWRI